MSFVQSDSASQATVTRDAEFPLAAELLLKSLQKSYN